MAGFSGVFLSGKRPPIPKEECGVLPPSVEYKSDRARSSIALPQARSKGTTGLGCQARIIDQRHRQQPDDDDI